MKFCINILFSLVLSGCAFMGTNTINNVHNDIYYANEQEIVITMERTRCYGICPIYRLTIFGTGEVYFEGINFVKEKRLIKSNISINKVDSILTKFEEISFFELEDQTRSVTNDELIYVTDAPSVIISYRKKGVFLRINQYMGNLNDYRYPKVVELSKYIDEIVGTEKWIG